MKTGMNIPKPENCIWFAFADYPEIKTLRLQLVADTRPDKIVSYALAANVIVGDYTGLVCHRPGTPESRSVDATLAYAKRVVDYQRKKQGNEKQP